MLPSTTDCLLSTAVNVQFPPRWPQVLPQFPPLLLLPATTTAVEADSATADATITGASKVTASDATTTAIYLAVSGLDYADVAPAGAATVDFASGSTTAVTTASWLPR